METKEGNVDPTTWQVLANAEAKKFLAEAEAAERLAEYHLANVLKANKEAEKAESEAHEAEANARKAEEEAENIRKQNILVGIAADQAKRAEADELALDRHHHTYAFGKSVSEGSVRECINQLTNWSRKNPECDIEIIFNSPGGSVVDGFALFDFIQYLRSAGHKVTTSALGMAASMAGILLQAGDTRVMGKQSWLMIHEASFAAVGKIGEVEDTVDWVKKVQERILDIFAERSNMSKAQIRTKWKRKDWWLSSDEALKLGFVDEIR